MIENRGKKQGFAPRSGDEKNPKAQKPDVRRRIFSKSTGLSAQRARRKKGICLLRNGEGALFYFLVLIWPARSGRKMFKRQGFCRSWASLRRRRGRQAVFREQFLAHLGFHSGPARPPGSL